MSKARFLRRILLADAASCLALGLFMSVGAAALAPLFALSQSILLAAGLALLPVALFIMWAATREIINAKLVWVIVAGNAFWVIESLVLLVEFDGVSPLGEAFIMAQALAVTVLSILEALGSSKLSAADI